MKNLRPTFKYILLTLVFGLALLNISAQNNDTKLVSLWNHETRLDLTPLVEELGFNLIWTHDPAYTNQKWEDTHMYKCLQVPGVKYVLAKIERAVWGWTQEESVRHAKWVAELSLKHEGIFGLYLNDFYDEVGLKHTALGGSLGWKVDDGMIDISFTTCLADDGTPCLVYRFSREPGPGFDIYA